MAPSVPVVVHTPAPLDPSTVKVTGLPEAPPVAVRVAEPPKVPVPGPVKAMAWLPGSTVRENDWVASGAVPLWAVMVKVKGLPAVAAGVPARVAVPLPLSVKVTPPGRVAPPSERVVPAGKSWPVVTVKVPGVPTVKVVEAALVMVGASSTVRVKDWVASGVVPLWAVMVKG